MRDVASSIAYRVFRIVGCVDRTRSRLFIGTLGLSLVGALSATTPASAVFDRFLIIQPIRVCADDGTGCVVVDVRQAGTAQTLEQAGVLPIYLPVTQFNNTALRDANEGPSSFNANGDGGSASALVLNMWFTGAASITLCGGDAPSPGSLWLGCAGGKRAVIDGPNAAFALDNGMDQNLIPHEIGHTLGLPHADASDTTALMNPSVQQDQFARIGVTNFLLSADEITTVRGNGKVQNTYADNCDDGDATPNAITVATGTACLSLSGHGADDILTLDIGSGVLQDVHGNSGDDTINVLFGSIVGGSVFGDSGLDTLNIGGLVMNDVMGGTGNDRITVSSTGRVINDVDGGDDDDIISIAGIVGKGNYLPTAPGTTNPGIVVVESPIEVRGGLGADKITIESGAIIAGNVYGDNNSATETGHGADQITMTGGVVIGDILGEGGNDIITIIDGVVRQQWQIQYDTDGNPILNPDNTILVSMVGGGNIFGGSGEDIITLLTGRIGTNIDGGADADSIFIKGGTVFGSVLGGTGGDKIEVSGGRVENGVKGEAGADTITVTGGVILNGVDGGTEADTINIAGGSISGGVLGGQGADKINITAGTINSGGVSGGEDDDEINFSGGTITVGDIRGDGGADKINLTGGTITSGGVRGGTGNDTIKMTSGQVGFILGEDDDDTIEITGGVINALGGVNGGSGNDTMTLLAGSVSFDFDGGADNDTMKIFGGSIGRSLLGGSGNDHAIWTGGTIAQLIDMGGDTDILDIYGVGAGFTALQAGLSELNGGSGDDDTLNLHGVQEVLTAMLNWDFINLINNSVGDLGTVGRSTTVGQFYVDGGSQLKVKSAAGGALYEFVGDLKNEGIIDMAHGGAGVYDVLRTTGLYTGGAAPATSSLLTLDTFLGAVGSPSDLMRVGNGTTGGTTGVTGFSVHDTNAGGFGVYNPIGIELVRVETAALSTAKSDFFLIGGPIEKDLWIFDHALDSTRSNPGRENADVHVLYSRPSDVLQFTPYFATGALTVFHGSLEPWIDRQHALADSVARETSIVGSHSEQALVAFSDPPGSAPARSTSLDIWVTPFGTHRSEDSVSTLTFFGDTFTADMDYSQGVYGIQGGIDFISDIGNGSAVMAGLFGGYVNSTIVPDTVSVRGKYTGGTVGGYANYMNGGFMLSGVVKADILDFDWQAPMLALATTSNVTTIGGRVEAAYKHFVLGGAGWLEPFTNVTYASSNWDEFSVAATTFDLSGNQSLLGRLGLRVGADVGSGPTMLKVYAGAGVAYEFDELNTASILSGGSTLPLTHVLDTTALELQGGVKWSDVASGISFGVNTSGRLSKSAQEYGGKATVNLNF